MSPKTKPGRKIRPRTTAEKLLMVEISKKLYALMHEQGWKTGEAAARKLKISPASMYNYLRKDDLASFEVLRRIHDEWGVDFQYMDFGTIPRRRGPSETDQPRQYILPFIEGVRESDIQIIQAKSVKPDTLQLTITIKFAG
jgi:hypothetical protein